MEQINVYLAITVSVITVITALLSGLAFIWRMSANLNNTLTSLNNGISRLNEHLFRVDAKADRSEERLDQHETRITVLEKLWDGEV